MSQTNGARRIERVIRFLVEAIGQHLVLITLTSGPVLGLASLVTGAPWWVSVTMTVVVVAAGFVIRAANSAFEVSERARHLPTIHIGQVLWDTTDLGKGRNVVSHVHVRLTATAGERTGTVGGLTLRTTAGDFGVSVPRTAPRSPWPERVWVESPRGTQSGDVHQDRFPIPAKVEPGDLVEGWVTFHLAHPSFTTREAESEGALLMASCNGQPISIHLSLSQADQLSVAQS